MGRLRQFLHRLFHPPGRIVALFAVLTVLANLYLFALGHSGEPIAYALYLFSAYALVIACVWIVHRLRPKVSALLHKNAWVHRYLTDLPFRAISTLYVSLALNGLYVVMNFAMGVYYRSKWFITLSLYYLILTVMRFLLLSRPGQIGRELRREYRQYRGVGIVMLFMNVALTGIVLLFLRENQSFHYAGSLIFAMAGYAFYTVIMAIRNLIRYRAHGSPVLSATKVIGFASALISMLALETAMLTQFGSEDDAHFRHVMVGATGGVISVVFAVTAVYMIVRSTQALKKVGK